MATVVAALLDRRAALIALRRALPGRPQRVHPARDAAHLDQLLRHHLVDAVVLGLGAARAGSFAALRDEFKVFPVFCYAPIRSDDGALVERLERAGATIWVESLDEPIIGRAVDRSGLSARRANLLGPLADELDLTTSLQREAWEIVIREAPLGLSTARIAEQLRIRREVLSRRFGAGVAPQLKLAIDAVRLAEAGELLACRGYRVSDVASLLGYSSPSLLHRTARRLLGPHEGLLGSLPADEIVRRAAAPPPERWD